MSLLARRALARCPPSRRARHLPRAVSLSLLALALLVFPLRGAGAQTARSHMDDATPVPAGMLRLLVTPSWTRYDERFAADGGATTLGAALSANPLGTTQLPRLAPYETALRTLTTDPTVRLSLGRLTVGGGARVASTSIALEYGITRRLSVGVVVPIVQTRRVVQASVNADSSANTGFVSFANRTAAAVQNAAVSTAFQSAAASLASLLSSCPQNPSASGCAAINANRADADATRLAALTYASGAAAFGITASAVSVAPQANSDVAQVLNAQRLTLNVRLQRYLGAGAGAPASIYLAPFKFSYLDLQGSQGTPGLLQSDVGGGLDSLHTSDRIGLGDVGVGAQLLVFDRFSHDSVAAGPLQTRLVVGAMLRFATSRADSVRDLADIPTGEGAGVEAHGAFDLKAGRLGATLAARYVRPFARTVQASLVGDPEAAFPYPLFGERARHAGDVVGLDVTPRFFLNEILALDAHYGLERVGATTYDDAVVPVVDPCPACLGLASLDAGPSSAARTAHRVGFGLRFSTVDAYARRHARYPVEVSFTHLETVRGTAGEPKGTRDQLQLRIYYRVRQ